jgi:hypothetical protein
MSKWYAIAYRGEQKKEVASADDYAQLLSEMDSQKESLIKDGYTDWEVKTR